MKYQLTAIIIVILLNINFKLNAQLIDEFIIPSKEVVNNAKSTVKQAILELRDSL
ncbi:MAG: hypothetical protein ACJA2S_003272 [Cyclobacteriaceae bacterium]|jgi:hypothetical protein